MKHSLNLVALGLAFTLGVTLGGCRQKVAEVEPTPTAPTPTAAPDTITTNPAAPPTATPTAPNPTTTASPQPTPTTGGSPGTALNSPQAATLTAQDAGAQINLRSQPDASSRSKGYGLVGDPVKLLRQAKASDGYTWYYVKFDGSGAEGWIRSDFITTAGNAVVEEGHRQDYICSGVFDELVFKVHYGENGYTYIEFNNLETGIQFDANLSYDGQNSQGQSVFVGESGPPGGDTYPIRVTGGQPSNGSKISLEYADIPATGTCE